MLAHLGPTILPAGTSVGAYLAEDEGDWGARDHAAPHSTAVATALVAADGTLDYSGLDPDTRYWAAGQVGGVWEWVGFRTEPSLTARFSNDDPEDVPVRIDSPAGQTGDAFEWFKGGVKTFWIDGDGRLHLTGALTDGNPLALDPNVVDAGNLTGAYALDAANESETWLVATLTGDATVTISNLAAGHVVRFLVSEDGTGDHVLTVTDGVVSFEAPIALGPSAASVTSVYTPDGDELLAVGPPAARPPVSLTDHHTLTAKDADSLLVGRAATQKRLVVPLNSAVALDVGAEVDLAGLGAGSLAVDASPGVAVWSPGFKRAVARPSLARLRKTATDEWVLSGDLSDVSAFNVLGTLAPSAWFDARKITGKESGDAISQWDDASGNGNHAIQATGAKQPLYIVGAENGFPAVRGDGVDDLLTVAGITATDATRTIFCVAVRRAGVANAAIWDLRDLTSVLRDNAGWKYGQAEDGSVLDLAQSALELAVVTIRFNGLTSADAFVNDAAPINFNPKDDYATVGGSTLSLLAKGSGSEFFNGDLCELIVCDTAVADVTLAAAQAALMADWGIA